MEQLDDEFPALSRAEAARKIGIGVTGVDKLRKQGVLEWVPILGQVRISPAALMRCVRRLAEKDNKKPNIQSPGAAEQDGANDHLEDE